MKEFFKRNPKQNLPGEAAEKQPASTTNTEAVSVAEVEKTAPTFSKLTPKSHNRNIPDNLWVKCPKCKELLYSKELDDNKKVCHKCDYHFRLRARERIEMLVDSGSFQEIDSDLVSADPLNFTSLAEPPYMQKMQQARQKTKLNEAVVTGRATIEGLPLALCVADFAFQGGSMGSVFGEKLVRAVEMAIEQRLPFLSVSASGGARMQEGMFSLMQMAKTTAALAQLGEERLLHISLLTDPITGGVLASYASVADYIIAEPGALIGFAGPRVIEQTTRQKLPVGFQSAEFVLEHGMLDRVVPRKELGQMLTTLLRLYMPTMLTPRLSQNGSHTHLDNRVAVEEGVYAR